MGQQQSKSSNRAEMPSFLSVLTKGFIVLKYPELRKISTFVAQGFGLEILSLDDINKILLSH